MSELSMSLASSATYQLRRAMLVYECDGRTPFVTVHDVVEGQGAPRLGAGYPVTQEAAIALAGELAKDLTFKGFVPQELLAIAPGVLAWWIPPSKRRVFFDTSAANPEEGADPGAARGERGFGKRAGVAPHPGLVMAATTSAWYVWALRTSARPVADTPLFRAPYFNVWADKGQVCVGNVRLPRSLDVAAMRAYEDAFFGSRFTHPNNGFRVRHAGGGYALWRSLLDAPPRQFPTRVLVPAKLTLGAFVQRLIKEKR